MNSLETHLAVFLAGTLFGLLGGLVLFLAWIVL